MFIYIEGEIFVTDGEIVKLFWQREEDAIKSAAEKYRGYLNTIALNILNNKEDAEECVNETFLKAWNAIPPARPKSLAPFLGRIVKNSALNLLRNARTLKRGGGEKELIFEELEECIPSAHSVEAQAEGKELEQIINLFLKSLSKNNRIVFMMRYWYCYSLSDIAEKTGTTVNSAAVTLSRVREKLKNFLEKNGYGL